MQSRARTDPPAQRELPSDRKSTRLNSSHLVISYAVFCLKKKKLRLRNALADALDALVSQPLDGDPTPPRRGLRRADGPNQGYNRAGGAGVFFFFFLMIRRPPRSTLFPTRRSSDLQDVDGVRLVDAEETQVAAAEQLGFLQH